MHRFPILISSPSPLSSPSPQRHTPTPSEFSAWILSILPAQHHILLCGSVLPLDYPSRGSPPPQSRSASRYRLHALDHGALHGASLSPRTSLIPSVRPVEASSGHGQKLRRGASQVRIANQQQLLILTPRGWLAVSSSIYTFWMINQRARIKLEEVQVTLLFPLIRAYED